MHDSPGTALIASPVLLLTDETGPHCMAYAQLAIRALYRNSRDRLLIELGGHFPVTTKFDCNRDNVTITINDPSVLDAIKFKHLIPPAETQNIAAEISLRSNIAQDVKIQQKHLLTISNLNHPQINPHHIVLDQNIEPEVIRKTLAGLDFAIAQHIITHKKFKCKKENKARNARSNARKFLDKWCAYFIKKLFACFIKNWSTYYNSADVLKDLQSNPIHQNSYKAAEAILGDSIKHYITEALANLDWVAKCQKLDLKKLTPDNIPKSGVRNKKPPLNQATLKESVSHYITDVFTNLDGVENCKKLSLIELITNDITQIVAESNKLPLNEAILSIKPFDVITITSSKPNKLLHLLSTRPDGLRRKPIICLPNA